MNTRIQKIDLNIIDFLDPNKDTINQYYKNLRRLIIIYNKKSIITIIPDSFLKHAKD